MLVEIDRLLGDAADHDAIAEHVEHQDIELARVSHRRQIGECINIEVDSGED